MPASRVCVALLGVRVSAVEAGQEQQRAAHVPQARCGKRAAHQAVAIRAGIHDFGSAAAVAG